MKETDVIWCELNGRFCDFDEIEKIIEKIKEKHPDAKISVRMEADEKIIP